MKKEIQVFCLPTNKATKDCIGIHIDTKKARIMERALDGNKVFEVGFDSSSSQYQPHHLYATTNEAIKEGDWHISFDGSISQCTSKNMEHNLSSKGLNWDGKAKKIVATTNMYLNTTDKQDRFVTQLPQISPEFQQAWVKSMNDNVPIVDALMEFEQVKQSVSETKKRTPLGSEYTEMEWEFQEQPKINSLGYVTILPKVEKMYSREEVIILLDKSFDDLMNKVGNDFEYNGCEELIDLIKQHL